MAVDYRLPSYISESLTAPQAPRQAPNVGALFLQGLEAAQRRRQIEGQLAERAQALAIEQAQEKRLQDAAQRQIQAEQARQAALVRHSTRMEEFSKANPLPEDADEETKLKHYNKRLEAEQQSILKDLGPISGGSATEAGNILTRLHGAQEITSRALAVQSEIGKRAAEKETRLSDQFADREARLKAKADADALIAKQRIDLSEQRVKNLERHRLVMEEFAKQKLETHDAKGKPLDKGTFVARNFDKAMRRALGEDKEKVGRDLEDFYDRFVAPNLAAPAMPGAPAAVPGAGRTSKYRRWDATTGTLIDIPLQ